MKEVKNLASNVWNRIKLYCGEHEEAEEMVLVSNAEKMREPYYQCPKEGCVENDYNQRVTMRDYEAIADAVEKEMSANESGDLTNYQFVIKRTEPQRNLKARVIYSGRKIGVSIRM